MMAGIHGLRVIIRLLKSLSLVEIQQQYRQSGIREQQLQLRIPHMEKRIVLYKKQTIQHLQYLEGSNVGIIEK